MLTDFPSLANLEPALITDLRNRLDRARHRLKHRAVVAAMRQASDLFHKTMSARDPISDPEVNRSFEERLEALIDRDLDNVQRGYYPASLLEWPVLHYIKATPELLRDLPRVVWRKRQQAHADLPDQVVLSHYPAYYRRTFHWQTDGWFSEHSARIYDLGVEMLFYGTADLMRRMVIPPLVDALKGLPRPRVLDVACGTGQFLRQLHQALPDARLFGVDLSPNYISYARQLLSGALDVTLLSENAEELPLAEDTFDAAYSIFLFHELPRDARLNVIREMHRVLKPGGRVVLCDSCQRCDNAGPVSYIMDWFPNVYHEPYYKDYVSQDLAEVARAAGFEVERVETHLMSKLVIGTKPARRS